MNSHRLGRSALSTAVAVAVAVGWAAPAHAESERTIAIVLPVVAPSLNDAERRYLRQQLAEALADGGKVGVVDAARVDAVVTELPDGSCSEGVCARRLATRLAARLVVMGAAERQGSKVNLSVRIFDEQTGEVAVDERTANDDERSYRRAVRAAIERLLSEEVFGVVSSPILAGELRWLPLWLGRRANGHEPALLQFLAEVVVTRSLGRYVDAGGGLHWLAEDRLFNEYGVGLGPVLRLHSATDSRLRAVASLSAGLVSHDTGRNRISFDAYGASTLGGVLVLGPGVTLGTHLGYYIAVDGVGVRSAHFVAGVGLGYEIE